MTQFMQRMMQPVAVALRLQGVAFGSSRLPKLELAEVSSLSEPSLASLDGDGTALLLCARTLTRGFLEAWPSRLENLVPHVV